MVAAKPYCPSLGMEKSADVDNPTSGLADQELIGKLKLRHSISEGKADDHCYISRNGIHRFPKELDEDVVAESCEPPQLGSDGICELPLSQPTPRGASPPSPSPDEAEAEELSDAAAEDQGEKLVYEWQFDILNSELQHEKAVALVEHLRRSERDRARASAAALQLQRANGSLRQRLDAAVGLLREKDPSHPGLAALLEEDELPAEEGQEEKRPRRRPLQCMLYSLLVLVVVAVFCTPAVALVLMASSPEAPAPFSWAVQSWAVQSCRAMPDDQGALEDARRALQACEQEALLRPGPANGSLAGTAAVVAPDAAGKEDEADKLRRCQEENEQMRSQLERLWTDIEEAVQRKQDMVCWKL